MERRLLPMPLAMTGRLEASWLTSLPRRGVLTARPMARAIQLSFRPAVILAPRQREQTLFPQQSISGLTALMPRMFSSRLSTMLFLSLTGISSRRLLPWPDRLWIHGSSLTTTLGQRLGLLALQ